MDNWINILIKSSALLIGSLFLVRIMGKKSLTSATPFTFVNYIVVSIIVALIVTEVVTNVAFGLVALGVWVIFPILIDLLSLKSKGFHDLIHGRETILVKQGKIMEENLMDVRLTGEELLRELRKKNAFSVSDVEFAILEATGDIHVLMKSEKTPITPSHLGIHVSPITEPQTVILDGVALNESLSSLGKTPHWLKTELEKIGVSIDNVFLGQVNSFGELYVDLFNDATKIPENTTRELLWTNLEKCQADLLRYSLETQNEGAKNMYHENSRQIEELLKKLKPYL
jgi:uncharacterized membrane protein YcaP (DUF421 family)